MRPWVALLLQFYSTQGGGLLFYSHHWCWSVVDADTILARFYAIRLRCQSKARHGGMFGITCTSSRNTSSSLEPFSHGRAVGHWCARRRRKRRRNKLCPHTSLIRPRHELSPHSSSVCGNCGYRSECYITPVARHEVRTPLFVLSFVSQLAVGCQKCGECSRECRASSTSPASPSLFARSNLLPWQQAEPEFGLVDLLCPVPAVSKAAHDGTRGRGDDACECDVDVAPLLTLTISDRDTPSYILL